MAKRGMDSFFVLEGAGSQYETGLQQTCNSFTTVLGNRRYGTACVDLACPARSAYTSTIDLSLIKLFIICNMEPGPSPESQRDLGCWKTSDKFSPPLPEFIAPWLIL